MNITTSFNDNYVNYAIVMLTSLLLNNPGHHTYYMLNHSLSEASIKRVYEALKDYDIEIIPLVVDFGSTEASLPTTSNWTIDTYSTLLIQDILPENVDRILYLDADTIINTSIEELYSTPFEDSNIIAAKDSNGKNSPYDYSEIQNRMMREGIYSYFNTGTMLMNITGIRKNGGFKRYLEAMKEWDYKMTALEQDILNYVHMGHVKYILWEKYNLFSRFAHNDGWNYETVKNSVSIVHFAGVKPWQNLTFHYDIEKLWWDYAEKSKIYDSLVKRFMDSLFFSNELENSFRIMAGENKELKKTLEKTYGLLKKLNI